MERAVRDANFLPFLGQGKLSPRNGSLFMPIDLDAGTAGRSGEGVWPRSPPDTARDLPCAMPASPGSPCENGSWRTRWSGGKAMLGVGKSHARYSRETKVAVVSVIVDGDAQARGHGKHGRVSRWLSASIRTCRKSHFELMRGAMFHTARSM